MNYTLSDVQQNAIEKIAAAEMRSVSQVVGLLLAEGISWMYVDYSSRYDDVNEKELEDQLIKEIKDSL
jgi:hypothetical protein